MTFTKALIIDEPWLSKILNGEKDWEMRSTNATHRGLFGLIRKGSGKIYGVANLSNVSGPYNNQELAKYFDHHQVGADIIENPDYKWRYAWKLADVQVLEKPVSYIHKNGAVTWVSLDEKAIHDLQGQLDGLSSSALLDEYEDTYSVSSLSSSSNGLSFSSELRDSKESDVASSKNDDYLVPCAKDGTFFSEQLCNNKGFYTVGEKGDEQKFRNFEQALDYLKGMPKAKWRRPNQNGNWGIVSAVDWIGLPRFC